MESVVLLSSLITGYFLAKKIFKAGKDHLREMQENHPEEWGI